MSLIGSFCETDSEWAFIYDGDVSPCYAALFSSLLPFFWLVIVGTQYWRQLSRLTPKSASRTVLLGVILSEILSFLPLLVVLFRALDDDRPSPYEVFFAIVNWFNWGYAAFILHMRGKAVLSSYVPLVTRPKLCNFQVSPTSQLPLGVFWVASFLFASVQFRSLVRTRADSFDFYAFCGLYPVNVITMLLGLWTGRRELRTATVPLEEQEVHGQSLAYAKLDETNETRANCWSYITFGFMNKLIATGYRRPLEFNDLDELRPEDKPRPNLERFRELFVIKKREAIERLHTLKLSNPTNPKIQQQELKIASVILRAAWAMERRTTIAVSCIRVFVLVLEYAGPLGLNWLVTYLETPSSAWFWEEYFGYFLVVAISLASVTRTLLLNWAFQLMLRVGLRLRGTGIALIYAEAVKMTSHSKEVLTAGFIQNLMSSDMFKIEFVFFLGFSLVLAPVQILTTLTLLFFYLGWIAALCAVGVFVVLFPIQSKIVKSLGKYKKASAALTDQRVTLEGELFQGMKIIKFQAWEKSFLNVIDQVRKKELSQLWYAACFQSLSMLSVVLTPVLVSLSAFAVYAAVQDTPLTAATAFTVLVLVDQVRLAVFMLPMAAQSCVDGHVAVTRLGSLLQANDAVQLPEASPTATPGPDHGCISVAKTEFRRSATQVQPTMTIPMLFIPKGVLTVVVGAVGAGKSFLLQSLLGETYNSAIGSKTTPRCSPIFTSSTTSVAYVSQVAWIFNASVRDNILFGLPFDAKLYEETIRVCCLGPDLEMLPSGDQTEIGERGINLSGGQKQRVSLARAVYRRADVYYFDDPLSALDAHVGRTVFESCINGVLKSKTRVLVTHQVSYASSADVVIFVESSTRRQKEEQSQEQKANVEDVVLALKEIGSFAQLLTNGGSFARYYTTYTHRQQDDDGPVALARAASEEKLPAETAPKNSKAGQLVEVENREVGMVKRTVWFAYFKMCGKWGCGLALLTLVLVQGFQRVTDFWLAEWTSTANSPTGPTHDLGYYIGVYFGLSCGIIASSTFFQFFSSWMGFKGATAIHRRMLASLIRAPMSFFDTTPTGRILNRFTKDMFSIDQQLAMAVCYALNSLTQLLSLVLVVAVVTEYFALVLIPLAAALYWLQQYYRATSRELKRLDSISRSPLFAQFAESLEGLQVIRAYRSTARMIAMNEQKILDNFKVYYLSNVANRWLGIRLDTLGAAVMFFTGTFLMLIRAQVSPGLVGLAMGYSLQQTMLFTWFIRQSIDAEVAMNAVERTEEYSSLPAEGFPHIEGGFSVAEMYGEGRSHNRALGPPVDWPSLGRIEIANVNMRFRPDTPLVLRSLTVTIEGGQRVGVVGRTGAGKSSLMLLLFRIVECEQGTVLIDSLDIAKMPLQCLRSKMAIIPQDPVLFNGTLQYNLDPFHQYTEEELWRALKRVRMDKHIQALSGGLDCKVLGGGENFSVGQRQLLCLARALLRKSRILILDEATASVDLETDALIQGMVKDEFAGCTVLSIAHRLETVLDYDRILVLDKGMAVEFGEPGELKARPQSLFSHLLAQHQAPK